MNKIELLSFIIVRCEQERERMEERHHHTVVFELLWAECITVEVSVLMSSGFSLEVHGLVKAHNGGEINI